MSKSKKMAKNPEIISDVELRNINTIKPYWRNPRVNNHAIEAVKKSIRDYGFLQPVVVDTEGTIIVGHTRYVAMQRLGADDIPVIVASNLTEKQSKEYRIADNATGDLSDWDDDKLLSELRELEFGELDIYFPELNLVDWVEEDMAAAFEKRHETPTQEEIEQEKELIEQRAREQYESILEEEIEMMCPHCGEEFIVHKRQILKD